MQCDSGVECSLTAEGRLEEAYRVSQATNTFPEICGRICPQDRLCEGNCVIEQSGHGTVTIGAIEKYITDTAWEMGWVKPPAPAVERPESIGIIGAGPGGLAAADREQAGVLEAQRKQATQAILAPLFDSLRRYYKRQGRSLLHFIKEFVPPDKQIRVLGENGKPEFLRSAMLDALLADLASNRGRRVEVEVPEDDEDGPGSAPAADADDETSPHGQARVFSMQERRRAFVGNHPAGSKLHQGEDGSSGQPAPGARPQPDASRAQMDAPTAEVAEVTERGTQGALPEMPPAPKAKPKRRPRRSVPSWDEIVFGAKPE